MSHTTITDIPGNPSEIPIAELLENLPTGTTHIALADLLASNSTQTPNIELADVPASESADANTTTTVSTTTAPISS